MLSSGGLAFGVFTYYYNKKSKKDATFQKYFLKFFKFCQYGAVAYR